MLESYIEKEVTRYAAFKGWLSVKLKVRGWPDRAYFKNGKTIFVEFKQPGRRPRADQNYYLTTLKERGFDVYVCDNTEAGKQIFN
ncbi:MAG: VRR-NUC domain-containing protein [Chloroflexi bacterium]|nr:MAG: VRR-NUC domain-containing protein [Chloroflexota bacterium]